MIIDIYTHIAPKTFLDRMVELAPKLGNIVNRLLGVKPLYDLDVRFRDMDTVPEYRQLLSLPNPSLEEIGPVSTGRVDAAIREADRAIHQLGAKGVLIYNHVDGLPLDDKRFRPFFAAMAEWDRPIWLHPTRTASVRDYASEEKSRFEMWWCFGWPYDTSVAMTRLVFDGLFDRHPDINIITHHMGGMIPFFDGRVGPGLDVLGARTSDEDYSQVLPSLKKPHMEYFKQFYGDTAMFGATTGVKCGLDFFGPSQVVFATDAPLGPIKKTYDGVSSMELSPQDREAIFYGNAARLLKL